MKSILRHLYTGILGVFCSGIVSANLSFTEQGMTSDFDDDGQNEIVRIIRVEPGGSGIFYYLAVIDIDEKGELNFVSVLLGDRVQFLNFWKDKGAIAIDMVQAGKDDYACCPTNKVVRRWRLQQGKLMEQPIELYGQVSLGDLVRLKWRLLQIDRQKLPPDAGINLVFGQGQVVQGSSGCNRYKTTTEESSTGKLKIKETLATTRIACSEQQMEQEKKFLKRLSQVNSYSWMGDYMTLNWQVGSEQGSLLFQLVKD